MRLAWTPQEDAVLVGLRKNGRTSREIAAAVGRTPKAVKRRTARLMAPMASHSDDLCKSTAKFGNPEYMTLPDPAPEAREFGLPEALEDEYAPFKINKPGSYLIISDLHIPFHSISTIKAAFAEAAQMNVTGIIWNGDIIDAFDLSRFSKEPNKVKFQDEIDKAKQLFSWANQQLPNARQVYKLSNHEERFDKYLMDKAPAVAGIKEFKLEHLFREHHYLEFVRDKRVIELGKLNIIHGDEFGGGGGGVMPARSLFLKTGVSTLCGHFHQISQYSFRTINRRDVGVWTCGCACHLSPLWNRHNQWSNGYAIVSIDTIGHFQVTNRRVLQEGMIV